jgi:hypothetical protein
MTRVAVLPLAALPVLAGCGSGGDDEASRSSAGGAGGTATCTDPAGDGGPADLTAVELAEGGEGLRATFTLAAPLDTASGTQLLALLVSSKDGKTAKQLGAKWVDGVPLVVVFDFGAGSQDLVDIEPQVDGGTVDVPFPRSALKGLGGTWDWRAVSNVGGQDVDACPEPGEDPGNPQQQTFPG